jgi:outer membrane protein assembly factor BamB/tetratricopeptide (TPR) repeat protein
MAGQGRKKMRRNFRILSVLTLLLAVCTLHAQESSVPAENVVLKTDRTLQVLFELVRESAAQKDYEKMFDRLREIEEFLQKNGEDFFLPDGENLYRPVRQILAKFLTSLPDDAFGGRRAGIDARAKGLFDRARGSGSVALLEKVAREYPLSAYAPVALEHAVDLRLESGDFVGVLRTLRTLKASSQKLTPETSGRLFLKELTVLAQLGESDEFEAAARRFAASHANLSIRFAGKMVEPSQAIELLRKVLNTEKVSEGRPLSKIGAMTASYKFPAAQGKSSAGSMAPGPVAVANGSFVSVTDGRFLQVRLIGASDFGAPLVSFSAGPGMAPSWTGNALHKPAVWSTCVAVTLSSGEQQNVYVYNAASRSLIWSTENNPELKGAYFVTSPVYADGVLFAGMVKIERETLCFLLALDAQNGSVLWKRLIVSGFPTNTLMLGCSPAPPTVKNGTVYFLTNLGVFAALDSVTGEFQFIYRYREYPSRLRAKTILEEDRWVVTEPIVCVGNAIFAPQDCAYLYVLDATSGKFQWRFPRADVEKYRFICYGGADRTILCGTGALALSCRTGLPLWEAELPAPACARPVCVGDRVFIPDKSGVLVLDAQTGAVLGRHVLAPSAAGGNLSLHDGLLFSCTERGFAQFADWRQSEPVLRKRVSDNPQDTEALLELARALLTAGELDECEKVCERALQLLVEPEQERACQEARGLLLSVSLERARQTEKPLEKAGHLERAADFADVPDLLRFLFEAAGIYEGGKLPQKALNAYQSALERSGEATLEISGVPNVSAAGYARERIRELIAVHGRAIYADLEEKAKELLVRGRSSALKVDMMRLIRNYPNSEAALEAYLEFAALCEREGSPETASRYLQELLYLAGDSQSDTVIRARQMLDRVEGTADRSRAPVSPTGIKCPLTKVWQTLPSALGETRQIIVSPDQPEIFLPVSGNCINCRRISDGTLIWRREIEGADIFSQSLFVHKGKSLFVIAGRSVISLTLLTGEQLWNFTVADPPEGLRNLPRTEPVLIPCGEVIAVWYPQFRITGLRAQTGEKLWERVLDDALSYVLPCGDFIVGCEEKVVTLIEAATGRILRKIKVEDTRILGAFPLAGSGKIFLRGAGEFFCIEVSSGKILWKTSYAGNFSNLASETADERAVLSSPISAKGLKVLCISVRDGSTPWRFELPESELKEIWVDENSVFIAAQEDSSSVRVDCLDCVTGKQKWSWKESLPSSAKFFSVPGYLIVTADGTGPAGTFTTVALLGKRSGVSEQQIVINGFCARTVAAAGTTLIVGAESALFGFRNICPEVLNLKVPGLVRKIEKNPDDISAVSDLAQALFALGRFSDAVCVLERGVLRESAATRETEFARLFEVLNSCAFAAAEQSLPILTARRFRSAPKIDGELTDEWANPSIKLNRPVCVFPVQSAQTGYPLWFSKEDLSAEIYLGYDSKNFYFLLDVKDSVLRPSESENRETWVGDLLLIAVDSLADGGYSARADDFMMSMGLTIPKQNLTEEEREEEERSRPPGEYFVKRKEDGSGAIYEGAIPWKTLREHGCAIDENKGPDSGFSFGANFVLTDDDTGGGSLKTLNLTPGVILTKGKTPWSICAPKFFANVVLEESGTGDR